MSRMQAFYSASQYQESLILLTELEKAIDNDPQRVSGLLKIQLYMALAHLALNQKNHL